jgi:hypothetical protein
MFETREASNDFSFSQLINKIHSGPSTRVLRSHCVTMFFTAVDIFVSDEHIKIAASL